MEAESLAAVRRTAVRRTAVKRLSRTAVLRTPFLASLPPMTKKHYLLAALALSLLLLAHTERARADSPYDPYASQDLGMGFDLALDAYQGDPSDPDAYDAALYGYYAQ